MRAKLHLTNRYHRPLPAIPFTYGIPVPEGAAKSVADIALLDPKGKPLPLAVQSWATWKDGSIRWALLDFLGDFAPSEKATYELALGEGIKSPSPVNPVVVKETNDGIEVANGRLKATFRRERFNIFQTLIADGVEIIGQNHRCDIVAVQPAGKVHRASYEPKPRLSLEDVSPLRAVVRWDGGLFAGDGTRFTEYRLKLTFFANNPYVKIEHSAICREQPERGVMIREYRIDLETALDRETTKIVRQKNHGVDYLSRMVELKQNVRLKVPTKGQDPRSDSAIGVLGTVGKVLLEDEAAFQENSGEFPHFLRPGAPRVAIGGGYAVVFPFLGVRDGKRTVVGSFLRMGPQHPKSVTADENRLTFDIWPAGYGDWRLSRGMTKTHHLAWSFFGRSLATDEVDGEAVRREFFAEYVPQDPVEIILDREYVRQTKQLEADNLLPFLPQKYPKLEAKISTIELHGKPLQSSGMMDWGEAISTNNEEDQGHVYAMEFYRSGTYVNYLKFVQQMLHNSTVDVVDWDPDPLRMGGTPYHTDYHQDAVCVTSHTWTEGMFEYAYVTGDREAFRAAVGLCEWILRWMKGKPHLVSQDGREIGWPIIALVAGYRATDDKRYLDGCWELVGFYKEKVAKFGELLNNEPPGANYTATLYGEYAGFEGLHKLWQLTGDEGLRKFAVECMEQAVGRGQIDATNPVARGCDMYTIYAAFDMSRDQKWLDRAKYFLPVVLGRSNWDGYMYRRIIHYLGLCHQQGWIDDNQVALKT
jgi:hypothetical protein